MIFWIFWNIGLVLMTLTNWLLKSIMHAKTYVFLKKNSLNENMMWFFFVWETWPYAWKQNIFLMFWQKSSILIPDLYLYSINIQTNIDQNTIKKFAENHRFFEIIFEENFLFFFFFRAGPSAAYIVGLDPATPAWSLAQASDLTKPCTCKIYACMNGAKVIKLYSHSSCLFLQKAKTSSWLLTKCRMAIL
jgi:hypothetical protein